MIDHLVWSGKLDGVSKKDVISMLGPASETNYFSDWDAVYYLGRERGLIGIDSEWLVIVFDDKDFVERYEVVGD